VQKQAYLRQWQTKTQEDHILYKAMSAKTKQAVKIVHQKS
jgi:hypothetical protein